LPTIAITTDFGTKDGNVGVMKGVIWGICPGAQIADVSHRVFPQNVSEAALVLARSEPYFPAGTIQLVVVDPGVGTSRRPIAARIGRSYYVGPDNGLISFTGATYSRRWRRIWRAGSRWMISEAQLRIRCG
jgi:S-adenosylmethionine hydrolase